MTEAEVEALIAPQLAELRQRGYQLRSQALDELIARRVVEREAVRRGVSVEALVKSEVDEKAVPTDADRRALYEANKSRFAGQSEAEAMRQIEPAARQQKRRERQGAFVADLRTKEEVVILLEPLRADLRVPTGAPARGPETAPITIVEFSDFQCPYCVRAQPTLRQAARDLRRQAALRLPRLSAGDPPPGPEGPRGRGLRGRPGEVLADVRPPLREPGASSR